MRLLILGASGGCGRWATRLAATDGHQVTALVRPETAFDAPPGVAVRRGSALDPAEIEAAARGHDAVVSCIGPQRTNPLNPWAPLKPPLYVATQTAQALEGGLERAGVRRVVVISAAGVGDSHAAVNPMMRWMLRHSTVGEMYADLTAMEMTLQRTTLEWVAVRPVTLVDAKPSNRTRPLTRYRTVSMVGRADVAAWLIRQAIAPAPSADRTPMIGWW